MPPLEYSPHRVPDVLLDIYTYTLSLFYEFFLISVLFLIPYILRGLSYYLIFESPPPHSVDLIVVLGGGDGDRVKKGAQLYNNSISKKILMTGDLSFFNTSYGTLMKDFAHSNGVPYSSLFTVPSNSTHTDARQALSFALSNHISSLVIVTSKFHTKRSYLTFKKVFSNSNIDLYIIAVDDSIDYNSWWTHYEMADGVLVEWGKMIVYYFKIL